MIRSLMIFQLSFKALQMLNIIKWRIFIEEEGHACKAPGSWGGPLGPHIDAMCVVVCGTCWFCIMTGDPTWSGKSPTGTMLAFYWSFLLFLFCFFSLFARGLCTNNQKFKGEVLHNLPKALITIEEHM